MIKKLGLLNHRSLERPFIGILAGFMIFSALSIFAVSANFPPSISRFSSSTPTTVSPALSRVGALTFNNGENLLTSSVVDPVHGFAYFGTDTSPGIVVKVRLADFAEVGSLTLNPGENGLTSALVDPARGFAYFGTGTSPGIVVKIRLSDFSRVG